MTKMTLLAFEEAVKEAVRTFLAGFLTVLTSMLTMINIQTGVIVINWTLLFALTLFSLITAVYRGIEKFLYEKKSENPVTAFLKFE